MRMFVAVVPPAEVLGDLGRFLEPLHGALDSQDSLRWTHPDQWHLTLAFMASVTNRRVDDLEVRLERAARRRAPVRLQLVGGGAFPNSARARICWVGTPAASAADLSRLASGARAAANKSGAGPVGARFRAHVTIARVRSPIDVSGWLRVLDAYVGPEWTADEIALIRSQLGAGSDGRPRYETVAKFPLGSRAAR
jgi:RNA 2',3'-cyclic 3'-phosphodiesterase